MPHAAVRSAADDEDNEVYGFACEWQDPVSGLTKDIRMLYYTADNSIELVIRPRGYPCLLKLIRNLFVV
jgi:hypothetical protein